MLIIISQQVLFLLHKLILKFKFKIQIQIKILQILQIFQKAETKELKLHLKLTINSSIINSFQKFNINTQNQNSPNIPKAKRRIQTPLLHVSNNVLLNGIGKAGDFSQRAQSQLRYVTTPSNISTTPNNPFISPKRPTIFPSNILPSNSDNLTDYGLNKNSNTAGVEEINLIEIVKYSQNTTLSMNTIIN
jgi:hypothetical protein